MSNVIQLHPDPPKISPFLRVGHAEHRKCEDLLMAGKLPVSRFVFEAANVMRHSSLLQSIQLRGCESVLDPSVAELSAIGRCAGAVSRLPWAAEERPLNPDDFRVGRNVKIGSQIARFALENRFDTVLSPAHLIEEDVDWLGIDFDSCKILRDELDRLGGENVVVDYQLIVPYSKLNNERYLDFLIERLQPLPFEYLWVRIAGFGMDANPTAIGNVVKALMKLQRLKRPIICDYLSGLTSLAICSFGAASGFAHGLESKERFHPGYWKKPSSGSGFLGREKTLYFDVLDRRLKLSDARKLLSQPGARNVLACRRQDCCKSTDVMLLRPEAHGIVQKTNAVAYLSQIPPEMRADRFVTDYFSKLRDKAMKAVLLRKVDENFKSVFEKSAIRIDRTSDMLEKVLDEVSPLPLVPTPFAREAIQRSREDANSVERPKS